MPLATLHARLAKAKDSAGKKYSGRDGWPSDDWRVHARTPWQKPYPMGTWQPLDDMGTFAPARSRAYYCDKWLVRHVGSAHDVCRAEHSRRVDHDGWYTDSFQSGTLSGHVLQLTGRNRKAVYIPGTAHSEYDGVTLYPLDMYDNVLECAQAADSYAEHAAESERDFDARECARIQIDDSREEIVTLRTDARALVRDMKAARRNGIENYPAICAALRSKLADVREASHKAYYRIERLTDNYWLAVES